MRETMAGQPPLPHQRRRRHVFVKIVSTLCLCGSLAVLIDLGADEATQSSLLTVLKSRPGGSSSASASATTSSARNFISGRTGVSANFRLLGGVNKIKPGRTLKAALLKTHLRFNPFPTTAGQQVNPVESNRIVSTLFFVFPATNSSLSLPRILSPWYFYTSFAHSIHNSARRTGMRKSIAGFRQNRRRQCPPVRGLRATIIFSPRWISTHSTYWSLETRLVKTWLCFLKIHMQI